MVVFSSKYLEKLNQSFNVFYNFSPRYSITVMRKILQLRNHIDIIIIEEDLRLYISKCIVTMMGMYSEETM